MAAFFLCQPALSFYAYDYILIFLLSSCLGNASLGRRARPAVVGACFLFTVQAWTLEMGQSVSLLCGDCFHPLEDGREQDCGETGILSDPVLFFCCGTVFSGTVSEPGGQHPVVHSVWSDASVWPEAGSALDHGPCGCRIVCHDRTDSTCLWPRPV